MKKIAVVLILTCASACLGQQTRPEIETLLPEDTVLLVSVNSDQCRKDYPGSALDKIVHEQQIDIFLNQGLAGLNSLIAQEETKMGFSLKSLKDVVTGRLVLALFLEAGDAAALKDKPPGLCILAETRGKEKEAADLYAKALSYLETRVKVTVKRGQGDQPDVLDAGDGSKIYVKCLNGLFVLTTEEGLPLFENIRKGRAARPLSDNPLYQQCRGDQTGALNVALLAKPLLDKIRTLNQDPQQGERRQKLLDACGLSTMRFIQYASSREQDTPWYTSKMKLVAGDTRSGLWSLASGKPFNRDILNLVPDNTTSFNVSSVSLTNWHALARSIAAAVGPEETVSFDKTIADAGQEVGIRLDTEIAQVLGEQIAVASQPAGGFMPMLPQYAVFLELKDPKGAEALLHKFFVYGSQKMPPGPDAPALKETTISGTKMYYLLFKGPMPIALSPAAAIVGHHLLITTHLMGAQRLAAHVSGETKFATLATKPAVVEALKNVPANASFFSWNDTPSQTIQTVAMGGMMAGMVIPALKARTRTHNAPPSAPLAPQNNKGPFPQAKPGPNGQAPAATQKKEIPLDQVEFTDLVNIAFWPQQPGLIAQHLRPTYTFATKTDSGLETVTRGNFPVQLSAGSPATAAVLAGLLLPAIASARDQARTVTCASNLRQIGLACAMCTQDTANKTYPRTLKELFDKKYLTTPRILVCPLDESAAAPAAGKCSYEFFPGTVEQDITAAGNENLMIAWDKKTHRQGRNVLFLDGHVQTMMPEGAFQKALAEQMQKFTTKKEVREP